MKTQVVARADISICTLAIRNAHESGGFGMEDCGALQSAYVLSRLFESIHPHAEIFDATAQGAFSKLFLLIRDGLAAPDIGEMTDMRRSLQIRDNRSAANRLAASFHDECRKLCASYVAHFLADIQMDILNLAHRPRPGNDEIDDANYVIGMLEITASNFARLAETADKKLSGDFSAADKFLVDSCEFVSAVRRALCH